MDSSRNIVLRTALSESGYCLNSLHVCGVKTFTVYHKLILFCVIKVEGPPTLGLKASGASLIVFSLMLTIILKSCPLDSAKPFCGACVCTVFEKKFDH